MPRKGMDFKQLNAVMKKCSETIKVRCVSPTIHPGFKQVVAFTIHTADKSVDFSITNHPDENFDLNKEVHTYLDELKEATPTGTVFM